MDFIPKIHPSDLIWWNSASSFHLLAFQDDSGRFDEEDDFTFIDSSGPSIDWLPWNPEERKVHYEIAFEVDPSTETIWYNIHPEMVHNLVKDPTSKSKLEESSDDHIHSISFNGREIIKISEEPIWKDHIKVGITTAPESVTAGSVKGFITLDFTLEDPDRSGYASIIVNQNKQLDGINDPTIFSEEMFKGFNQVLKEGTHHSGDIYLSTIGSIFAPPGYEVYTFSENQLQGAMKKINQVTRDAPPFTIQSLYVDNTLNNEQNVILHSAGNNQNFKCDMAEGVYTQIDHLLPTGHEVSGISIAPEYRVYACSKENFEGRCKFLTGKVNFKKKTIRSIYIDHIENNKDAIVLQSNKNGKYKSRYLAINLDTLSPGEEIKLTAEQLIPLLDNKIKYVRLPIDWHKEGSVTLYDATDFSGVSESPNHTRRLEETCGKVSSLIVRRNPGEPQKDLTRRNSEILVSMNNGNIPEGYHISLDETSVRHDEILISEFNGTDFSKISGIDYPGIQDRQFELTLSTFMKIDFSYLLSTEKEGEENEQNIIPDNLVNSMNFAQQYRSKLALDIEEVKVFDELQKLELTTDQLNDAITYSFDSNSFFSSGSISITIKEPRPLSIVVKGSFIDQNEERQEFEERYTNTFLDISSLEKLVSVTGIFENMCGMEHECLSEATMILQSNDFSKLEQYKNQPFDHKAFGHLTDQFGEDGILDLIEIQKLSKVLLKEIQF